MILMICDTSVTESNFDLDINYIMTKNFDINMHGM